MTRRTDVPAPDMGGTDPNEVLLRRFQDTQVGHTPTTPKPAHTPPTPQVRAGKGATRPDPDGMKRTSLYITRDAAAALEAAADTVLDALGGDVPRHVALSALLEAGARQAPAVAQELVRQRTEELAARLNALQHHHS
ncbi:hypothetical protein ABT324_28275 [Saccharopolyspora sp. NPDC000359]|uniref:hypothetical protein n=1 Tax=Saccharopolyspora sp. NPDC000359 TaxID=3154251 RepID=UPI003320F8C8